MMWGLLVTKLQYDLYRIWGWKKNVTETIGDQAASLLGPLNMMFPSQVQSRYRQIIVIMIFALVQDNVNPFPLF